MDFQAAQEVLVGEQYEGCKLIRIHFTWLKIQMDAGLKIRWQTLPGSPLPLPGSSSSLLPWTAPPTPRLVPWTIPPETLPPLKPRKRKNENALFGGIGQLGGSGWRGSIRLVKLVWLVLPKKLCNGPKGPIYSKRSKNVKDRDFPYSPLRILH